MRLIFFCVGIVSFCLGAIGVFVPVLPTTPLILLSAYCLGRASKRFHRWLTGTRIYKEYAQDFIENKTMTRERKIYLLTFASVMLLFPLIMLSAGWKLVILATYAYLYYYFLFRIKTAPAAAVKKQTVDRV